MAMTLYVGNLPFSADQESVQDLFAAYGDVLSVKLMSDRETGRPRGFGERDHPHPRRRGDPDAPPGDPRRPPGCD